MTRKQNEDASWAVTWMLLTVIAFLVFTMALLAQQKGLLGPEHPVCDDARLCPLQKDEPWRMTQP